MAQEGKHLTNLKKQVVRARAESEVVVLLEVSQTCVLCEKKSYYLGSRSSQSNKEKCIH